MSEWISINDRLPDPDAYILLAFEGYTLPCVGIYTVDDEDNGTFRDDRDVPFTEYGMYVNAWMPLPEPYKYGGN